MIGPNPDAWEALQENPDQGYAGEGAMSDAVEWLGRAAAQWETDGWPSSTAFGERMCKAIREVLAENERLRAAIVEWGRAESLPDCPACAVFDATLGGGDDEA
jgi:hypothetical protein